MDQLKNLMLKFLFGYGCGVFIFVCSHIAIAVVIFIFMGDTHWTAVDPIVFWVFLIYVMLSRFFTDSSSLGEKIGYIVFLTLVCMAAFLVNFFLDHDCTFCLLKFPDLVKQYIEPQPGTRQRPDVLQLFADEQKTPQKCANCVSFISGLLTLIPSAPAWIKYLDNESLFESIDEYARISDLQHDYRQDKTRPIMDDPSAPSPEELRKLDEWYEAMRNSTKPKDVFKKFVKALAADIHSDLGKKLLTNMTRDLLCFPSSRLSGPTPSELLHNLKTPRFTAEELHPGDGPMQIDFDKLVAILRGDMMRNLPSDVCAMIGLAAMIGEDDTVLSLVHSAAKVSPLSNETELKGPDDAALLFPGLYVMKVDEDKDPDGSTRIEDLISLFKRLPIVDDFQRFETRQEYLAFFRWQIEHKIQDEFYFPDWLSRLNGTQGATVTLMEGSRNSVAGQVLYKGNRQRKFYFPNWLSRRNGTQGATVTLMEGLRNLVANQFLYRGNRQRIFDPTSDETLAVRAQFGAGAKTLRQVVLPGDASYGYLVPSNYYKTDAEKKFFRNKAMPTRESLLRMASAAWGRKVEDLESLRDKVVQIDYTLLSHWEYREFFETNGAILYLDAETRKPMGIWLSCRKQLILPLCGEPWEFAKFVYRCSEVIVAAMMHVAEYHLGWANRFNHAIRETLPHTHGLRVLMKPYTHGTGAVNWNAYQMLVHEKSILARADGFTNRGRGHSWGHFVKHSDMFSTFPQILEAKNLSGVSNFTTTLPYFIQGTALWNIHRGYVEEFVNLIYGKDDALLLNDEALRRFWHHINTLGRHLDPCVCVMDSALFFKEGVWPAFESTRTCAGLLDHANYKTDVSKLKDRRGHWCKETLPENRTKALYNWLESDCENLTWCTQVSYDVKHLRPDMGLPELSREALINLITRFIYEVTAGHQTVADNLPFIVDPAYGGVRRPKNITEAGPIMVDVSTWIFGTVISALTTIRSMPLLSDWSGLLLSWVDNKADWKKLSDADREERKKKVKQIHRDYKSALIINAHQFLEESLQRPQNQWSPFLNPAVQAGSIAV